DAVEVAQHLRVLIGYPRHHAGLTTGAAPQLASGWGRYLAVGARDRITVRIALGEAELGVDARHQTVGHRTLEYLGLIVPLAPAVAQLLDQEGLQQPVAPDHGERRSTARLGQGDRAVFLVVD